MLKVLVTYEKMDTEGAIKLMGYIEDFPEVQKSFTLHVYKDFAKVLVDFGRIYNLESFGDLLLLQTEWTVLEVVILNSSEPPKEVTHLRDRRNGGGREKVNALLRELAKLNNLARREPNHKPTDYSK